jgi:hypothetical protein
MPRRRIFIFVGVLVVLAGAAVAAYAYWTSGGSGTGQATAGTTANITVNQTSSVSGLYPGGPGVTLSGNFDNPNAGSVQISSITAVVSSISGGGTDATKPACTPADFSIGGAVGTTTVPSGTGVGAWSGLTIQMVNTAANQDNCKGATANITYTAHP